MSTVALPPLAEIRAAAAAHEREFTQRSWASVAQLAARWGVSPSTVRDIPRDELPYLEFGAGLRLKRRRFKPEDVEAYEQRRFPAARGAR